MQTSTEGRTGEVALGLENLRLAPHLLAPGSGSDRTASCAQSARQFVGSAELGDGVPVRGVAQLDLELREELGLSKLGIASFRLDGGLFLETDQAGQLALAGSIALGRGDAGPVAPADDAEIGLAAIDLVERGPSGRLVPAAEPQLARRSKMSVALAVRSRRAISSPRRKISTCPTSKRISLGRRTAWLLPDLKGTRRRWCPPIGLTVMECQPPRIVKGLAMTVSLTPSPSPSGRGKLREWLARLSRKRHTQSIYLPDRVRRQSDQAIRYSSVASPPSTNPDTIAGGQHYRPGRPGVVTRHRGLPPMIFLICCGPTEPVSLLCAGRNGVQLMLLIGRQRGNRLDTGHEPRAGVAQTHFVTEYVGGFVQ